MQKHNISIKEMRALLDTRASAILDSANTIGHLHNMLEMAPELFMIAAIKERNNILYRVLVNLGIDVERLRKGLESSLVGERERSSNRWLRWSSQFERIVRDAYHIALLYGETTIRPQYILIAVSKRINVPPLDMLSSMGGTYEKIKAVVDELHGAAVEKK